MKKISVLFTSKKTRPWAIVGSVVVVLLLCYLISTVSLIYSLLNRPVEIYDDIALYSQQEYLQFSDGKQFQSYLSTMPFTEQGEITRFYHADKSVHNNLIYGKLPDVYAVDILLEQDIYESVKKQYTTGDLTPWEMLDKDGFVAYFSQEFGSPYYCYLAFSDSQSTVRCIMVTNAKTLKDTNSVFQTVDAWVQWKPLFIYNP